MTTEEIEQVEPEDTYLAPPHGWTCFHCGETFTTVGAARDHFGFEPSRDPACRIKVGEERGLVMALRKAEQEAADAWHIELQKVLIWLETERDDLTAIAMTYLEAKETGIYGPRKISKRLAHRLSWEFRQRAEALDAAIRAFDQREHRKPQDKGLLDD